MVLGLKVFLGPNFLAQSLRLAAAIIVIPLERARVLVIESRISGFSREIKSISSIMMSKRFSANSSKTDVRT